MRMHALHPKWLRLNGGPGMPTADLWALCACPSCCISAEVIVASMSMDPAHVGVAEHVL